MSIVHELWGVFYKNELETVEMTKDDANYAALSLSQPDSSATWKLPVSPHRKVKPVFVLETNLTNHFIFGVREELKEAVKDLRAADADLKRQIDDAVKEHSHLADNYWHARHKAFLRVEACKRILEEFSSVV